MTAPAVPPPRNPGETITAYMTRLDEWSKEQSAPGATPNGAKTGAAAPNNEKPAGTEVSPGRVISPNGLTTYMYTAGTGWAASPYPPGAADKAAAGIGSGSTAGSKTGGGSTYTPFPTTNERKAAEQTAAGLSNTPPPGFYVLPGGTRATDGITVAQKDPITGNWSNAGYSPNKTDLAQAAMVRGAQGRGAATGGGVTPPPTPATPPIGLPGGQPFSPDNPNAHAFTTPAAAPLGVNPMFSGTAMTPGAPDTRTTSLGPVLNQVQVHNPNTGFNGFINKEEGTQAPFSLGYGPAVSTNAHAFSQGARGYTEDSRPFGNVSYTTPNDYNRETGFNTQGFATPTTIGVTYGAPNYNPLAGANNTVPLQIAGSNVSFMRPDGSTTGFVRDAMPSSNIGLAQGRDFSGLNPAAQSAAQFVMLDRQLNGALSDSYRTPDGATIFGGYGGDYSVGDRGFAGGGRIAVRPLGSPFTSYAMGTNGPKSMVTNGPKLLIDARTGRVEALMGEDNADPGTAPNRERLTFSGLNNSLLNIKPLQPFATGGSILTQTRNWDSTSNGASGPDVGLPSSGTSAPDVMDTTDTTPTSFTGGGYVPPVGGGGGIYGNPTAPTPDPTGPTTPTTPVAPAPIPGDQPVNPYVNPGYTNDPTILAPWQQAAQQLAYQNHLRQTIDEPRRRAAGMIANSATGLDVLQGDVPTNQLGPGMYYDPSGQINKVIGEITNTQSNLQQLGGAEDMNPIQQRATYIGNALEDMNRIRDLEISKIAADTGAAQDAQGTDDAAGWLQAAYDGMARLGAGGGPVSPQALAAQQKLIDYWTQRVNQGQQTTTSSSSPGSGSARIQAQIDSLKARLPKNPDGTVMNEGDAQTELALMRDRIAKNQQRTDLSGQLTNLKTLGVPALNAPILAG